MRKAEKLLVLVAGFMLLVQLQAKAQATDYKFHTVFIYNFTKYIKWPDDASQSTFVIGVLGKSDITNALKEMATAKSVNGKPIEIKTYNSVEEIRDCHMIFLPNNRSAEVAQVRNKIAGKATLIISEKAGLAREGSDINFILNDGRWKFELNQATSELRKLKVSQELIKFAHKVYTEV